MKKSKKIGLELNKKIISNLKQSSINGGGPTIYYCGSAVVGSGCGPNTQNPTLCLSDPQGGCNNN